mgnify:CR=1 FL=1
MPRRKEEKNNFYDVRPPREKTKKELPEVTVKTLYLMVMVGIITVVTLISVPSLFLKRCPKCGKRNLLSDAICKACGAELPEHEK